MYQKNQEKIVFHIVFFVVFIFQVSSVTSLKYADIKLQTLLITINLIFFYSMIMYARWVWKGIKFFQAFLKTVRAETVLLLVSLVLFLMIKLIL